MRKMMLAICLLVVLWLPETVGTIYSSQAQNCFEVLGKASREFYDAIVATSDSGSAAGDSALTRRQVQ